MLVSEYDPSPQNFQYLYGSIDIRDPHSLELNWAEGEHVKVLHSRVTM